MAATPYALSIHHFITSVGADVGFASIIGLALLVLLFFAQARETSTLRRRADEAEEQFHRLEAYVDQLSRRAPVSAPVAAAPASAHAAARAVEAPVPSRVVSPEPVPVGALAAIPAAPAGVGAPALSAATRLIPMADVDQISIRALKPSTNGASAPTEHPPASLPPSLPPSTAAGGNGANGPGPIAPSVSVPMPVDAAADAPPPRVPPRQGPPAVRPPAPLPRRAAAAPPTGRRMSRVIMALAGLLGLAIIVVGVLVLTHSGTSPSQPASSTAAQHSTTTRASGRQRARRTTATSATSATSATAATVIPASVTVATLNGTATTNLAHDVMAKLTAKGYKPGSIATASDQTLTATVVGYTQPAYRRAAVAVAKSLNLGSASVQAVDPSDRTVACSATPTSCAVQVVVTVGADLASIG
jgi:hypothetical protein